MKDSSTYKYHNGIHVLRLSGSDYEMGYEHGRLLKEAVNEGAIPYYADFVRMSIRQSMGRVPSEIVSALSNAFLTKKVYRKFPGHVKEAFQGLADGAGLSKRMIRRAATMPEIFLWIISRNIRMKSFPLAPTLGCSSVAAMDSATATGEILYGRNLDYPGVGAWDRHHVVTFYKPDNAYRYASVSSAGILFGGITAMNEAGLCLGIHQHLTCDQSRLGGLPVGIIGDEIMRYAGSLEEAKEILDDHTPNACFTYLLASANEHAVLCYEVTPTKRTSMVFEGPTFGYTNFYLSPELSQHEYYMYPSHWHSNIGRYKRLKEQLTQYSGEIRPQHIAQMLGDRSDACCRLHKPISMLTTVSSAVFQPEEGILYAANGRAPVSNREYHAFSLYDEAPADREPLRGHIDHDERSLLAFDAYSRAYESYNNDYIEESLSHLKKSRELQPYESVYLYVEGLLFLLKKDVKQAYDSLKHALKLGHSDDHRTTSFHLWAARCCDLLQDRGKALEHYRMALQGSPPVKAAAERGLRRAWRFRHFGIEFNYADVVQP